MKKQTKKLLTDLSIIIGVILVAILGLSLFSITGTDVTNYKNVNYSSDFKSINYYGVIPQYNSGNLLNHNVFSYYNDGNLRSFSNPEYNPQLIIFYLVNKYNSNPSYFVILGTDRPDRFSPCGDAPAIFPSSQSATVSTESLGVIWKDYPSAYVCQPSSVKKYINYLDENGLKLLAGNMTCIASGTYSDGNSYKINGEVTWESDSGFDCHIAGTGKQISQGSIEFKVESKQIFYELNNNLCLPVEIFPSQKKTNDYLTMNECSSYLQLAKQEKTFYRLENNLCSQVTMQELSKTQNDYLTIEECNLHIIKEEKSPILFYILGVIIAVIGLTFLWIKVRK